MIDLVIVGNITNEPEGRLVTGAKGETYVCSFGVASNRRGANGNDVATFVRVSAWGKTGEYVANYLHKGFKVAVTADNISARGYQGNDGSAKASIEVTARSVENLTPRQDSTTPGNAEQTYSAPRQQQEYIPIDIDETLPF